MPFNGSGTFVPLSPPDFPALPFTTILASQFNNNLNDLFTSGLTNCITRDGQSSPTANIPMAGFRLTGLGAATADTDAAQIQQTLGLRGQVGTVDWNTRTSTGIFEATAASLTNPSANFPPTSDLGQLLVYSQGATVVQTYVTGVSSFSRQKLAGVWSGWIAASRQLQSIDATVAGNALTLTLNSTTLDFRSSTLTVGTPNTRSVPAPITLIVPSGATLGTSNGVNANLFLIAIDNAGTVELAVVNQSGNLSLDETGLLTTVAIGAGSSSNSVFYSTAARTNVPYRVVGFISILEATAGTWATAPTLKQGWGGEVGALAKPQTTLIVAQQTTSGTSIDFNIPSWANRIVLSFDAVSTNGGSTVQVQLGTTSSIEVSGYNGGVDTITSGGGAPNSLGSGLALERTGISASGLNRYGLVTFVRMSALEWAGAGTLFVAGSSLGGSSGATKKTLAGALTRIRVTTVSGTDTFDGGQIGCLVD